MYTGSCDGNKLVDVIIGDPHEAWRSLCSFLPQGLSPCKQQQICFLCNFEREREKEDAA
jgi:hypothetical protein